MGMGQDQPDFSAEWEAYRSRSLTAWALFLGYLPAIFLISIPLRWLLGSRAEVVVMAIALIWMACAAVACRRLMFWRCPRCKNRYASSGWLAWKDFWTRECLHCGLRKWAGDTTGQPAIGDTSRPASIDRRP